MCDPVIPLIASTVLTAGGTALQYDAQRDAQRDLNNQIAANNRRLEDQYALRRNQENTAKDQIELVADRETQQQRRYSGEAQDRLARARTALTREAQETARQEATQRRMGDFDAREISFDATPIGASGPKVIQERAASAVQQGKDGGRRVVEALSGLGALGDVQAQNAVDLTDMGRAVQDVARRARGSREIAHERIGGLNRSIAANASRPYETKPLNPKSGVSGIGSLLSGLGQIGMTAAMLSNPAAGVPKAGAG